jgi:hypothetical protein
LRRPLRWNQGSVSRAAGKATYVPSPRSALAATCPGTSAAARERSTWDSKGYLAVEALEPLGEYAPARLAYVLAGQEKRRGGQAVERWLTDLVPGPLPRL